VGYAADTEEFGSAISVLLINAEPAERAVDINKSSI
jgi:hypothetical protein